MSNILIIGASSFVGSNLVRSLVNRGDKVSIFNLPNTWHPFLDGLKLNVYYGDVRDKRSLRIAIEEQDFVYNIAGIISYSLIDREKLYSTHVTGTRNVLEAAKELGIKKVVVTASTAGIGIPEDKDNPLNGESPFDFRKYRRVMYMYSKYLSIQECKKAAQEGLNVAIVSPTTIYGQGDITMHTGNLINKIKKNKVKFAPPGGNAVVSIDDIVEGYQLVMSKGKPGQNYIFADEFITYFDMYNRIARIVGAKPIKRALPRFTLPFLKFFWGAHERWKLLFNKKSHVSPSSINFKFKFRYFDSSKARNELGWQPKVSFDQAIKKAVDFYQEYNLI
jgi:dihydroflavonol-4-reductase